MTIDAFHLPAGSEAHEYSELSSDDVTVRVPRLSPQLVRDICTALRDARSKLTRVPVNHIIDCIDEAARRVSDESSAAYDLLVGGIAAFTGYSRPMTETVIQRMSADWRKAPLERLLHAELGGAAAVDAFITRDDGTYTRAVAPPLMLHIFSGNVPGVSVTSIVRALLVKSAVFGKTAAGEPLLAPHFARTLADVDPVIGACIAIGYWSGGDEPLEAAALEHADAVVHYGSAAAIASLRARAPASTRFIEHGPRLSFAIVNADVLHDDRGERAAADLARAVALFDQQGCVSPQIAWVIGADAHAAKRFAGSVADALRAVQRELPRGRIGAGEAAAVRQLRTRTEFRSIRGDDVALWADDALAWTVIFERAAEFSGTCLNRTLIVKHAASLADVLAAISPMRMLLQTVGVAGFADDELRLVAAALVDAGASRITTLAGMPWPPVTWHHDGRGPLTELIRWADLER